MISGVDFICVENWRDGGARPEGPKPEARRAEAGVGFLGAASPLPQLGCLGERCKLPQWGLGRSPGRC